MKAAIRIIMTLLTVLTINFFCNWWLFSFIKLPGNILFIRNILSLIVAITAGIFVWKSFGEVNKGMSRYILLGGLIVGSLCFILGFVGPLIFAPENNLGPLLGILITGPAGFIIGLIAGGLYWKMKAAPSIDQKTEDE
jgi:hypothetical protein